MYAEPRTSHNWLAKKVINARVLQHLPTLDGHVVDLGCGLRPFELDILRYAKNYLGVDWAKSLHGLQADVVANLNNALPFQNESFDHVVSFEVLEHLCEPEALLREAYRILRPNGGIVLSTPFQWWLHEAPWDYYRYTRYGLEYLLGKAGFADIVVEPTTGFWTMWLLKLNYQLNRLPRGPAWIRKPMRAALIPVFWVNQTVAPWLDRIWPEENETAGYFVTARKP